MLNTGHYERLRKGYHVIRKDWNARKRRGGVSIALRKEIVYSRITVRRHPLNWSDRLELLALKLKKSNSKKTLVSGTAELAGGGGGREGHGPPTFRRRRSF